MGAFLDSELTGELVMLLQAVARHVPSLRSYVVTELLRLLKRALRPTVKACSRWPCSLAQAALPSRPVHLFCQVPFLSCPAACLSRVCPNHLS